MFSKLAVVFVLVVVAVARPDHHDNSDERGYQYQEPAQPLRATYQAPSSPEVTYAAPSAQRETHAPRKGASEELPLMPFDFGYIVQDDETNNAYGHTSNSDGKQVTGQYRILLPDTRTMIVTYVADKEHGYRADVTYEGEAVYPEPEVKSAELQRADSAPSASYSAPSQLYSAP